MVRVPASCPQEKTHQLFTCKYRDPKAVGQLSLPSLSLYHFLLYHPEYVTRSSFISINLILYRFIVKIMFIYILRVSGVSNVYWTVHHCNSWGIKNQLDVTCYLYFTCYLLSMFRTLICPSSGACDYADGLPHRLFCSLIVVCWDLLRVLFGGVLKTDILMFETCWANNKWNKDNKWHQVGF